MDEVPDVFDLEQYYWIGVMNGDKMARPSSTHFRVIPLEMCSDGRSISA